MILSVECFRPGDRIEWSFARSRSAALPLPAHLPVNSLDVAARRHHRLCLEFTPELIDLMRRARALIARVVELPSLLNWLPRRGSHRPVETTKQLVELVE